MEARSRPTCLRTSDPFNIRVRDQTIDMRWTKIETIIKSSLRIMQNAFKGKEVRFTWVMHKETNLLNNIGHIWTSECQIENRDSKRRKLWFDVRQSATRITGRHVITRQNLFNEHSIQKK